VTERINGLARQLGPGDRARLTQYLDSVREIESRIDKAVRRTNDEAFALPGRPADMPDVYDEHVKLMFDLQVVAFQSDMTRVISFKMGRDASGRVYPDSGVLTPFHPASHHGNKPEAVLDFCKINRYHVGTLNHLLDKLKGSMEGDAHLLDKTMIIYGSPMGDPNVHNHKRCPLIAMGGANGKLKGGLHLKAPDRTPMADAMLTLLHKLGMDDLQSFGDSTSEFSFSDPSANVTTSASRG
jgi:hypothetical protein